MGASPIDDSQTKAAHGSTIGIIGGTGLYQLDGLTDVEQFEVTTPFGAPSSPITRGRLGASELLFISRHGPGHVLLPSEVNYRANIYALKELGARWCIGVSAVGSLREQLQPGNLVIPDQIIDRTKGRESTFFGDGLVAHVPFADPYCPVLSRVLTAAGQEVGNAEGKVVHGGGVYLVMEGPAFSTRAESNMYRSWGADIIGMTGLPEAKLAREAEMAFAVMAMVTDYDCWRSRDADVDIAEILATMSENIAWAKRILARAVQQLEKAAPSELAAEALRFAFITDKDRIPPATRDKLRAIVGRYLD